MMTPRQTSFAQQAARNKARDNALVLYLKLRRLGWTSEQAWVLAQGGELAVLPSPRA